MPKIALAQTQFLQGEFGPLMVARTDREFYKGGAARLLNRRPLSQGGTATRPAFQHIANLLPGAVLIPFVFRSDQRYVLALSDGYLSAWTAEGQLCLTSGLFPWTADMLPDLNWCVAGDTILVFHPTMFPQRIIRTGATSFLVGIAPIETPGMARLSPTSITLAVSAVGAIGSGAIVTFSSNVLTPGHVNRWLRWRQKRALITAYTSPTQGTVTWYDITTGLDTSATNDWQEQAWAPEYGWPSCGAVQDGRLWLAATTSQPSSLWASRVGAPFDFDTRAGDDADGIAESVGGIDAVPKVRHLVAAGRLLVMTDTQCYFVPSSDTKPTTPKTVAFRSISEIGASTVRPAQNDGAVLYVDATGRVAREARYTFSLESFTADPVSLLAHHLVKQPVAMTGVLGNDDQPARLVVLVNSDGTMSVQHSIASERINAWMPWETNGLVKSAAGVGSDLFIAVERAGTLRLERASETLAPLDGVKRIYYGGGKTRYFIGWQHLAGLTCAASSKGHDLGDVVVADDGSVTLSNDVPAVSELDVGLRFSQVIRPLPINVDLPSGDTGLNQKRLTRVYLRVVGSGTFRVDGSTVVLGFQGDDFDNPPATFNSEVEVRTYGVDRECQVSVEIPQAYRWSVLSMVREVQING